MTENALSIFLCGFREKYSTQHAVTAMIQRARKTLNKGETFGALLTDLSITFDCMTHYLFYKEGPRTELSCIQLDICLSDRKETKSQN